ncbi:MAG: hypothetical protein ACOCQ2_03145 [Halanaerobiales bacterium]
MRNTVVTVLVILISIVIFAGLSSASAPVPIEKITEKQNFDNIRVLLSKNLTEGGSSLSRDFDQIILESRGAHELYTYQNGKKRVIAEIDGLSGIILASLGNRMAVFVNREFVGSADDNLYLKKVAEENK